MREWTIDFWKTHGTFIVLIICTLLLAAGFMFVEPLKETGKIVLTGVLMVLFNKIDPSYKKPPSKKKDEI